MGGLMAQKTDMELRYERGDASADQIQEVVDEVLRELAVPGSEAAQEAHAAGFDPGQLASAQVTVREGAQGVEPFLTAVLIGIVVSLGSKAAEALWDEILWPRIRRRLGTAALKDKQSDQDPPHAQNLSLQVPSATDVAEHAGARRDLLRGQG